jgi:ElaB/YqjD/DUF883 family membrane-anchored ribosome-binding protein
MTLEELYQDYNDGVKPLLILVEARLEKFPIGILNEVRAAHDHVARTFDPASKPEDKNKEFESASRHIHRIMLDAYKVLCLDGQERIEQLRKDYRGVRLGEVDSGRFLPELTRLHELAIKAVEEAKLSERSGGRNAGGTLIKFEQALAAWDNVFQFLAAQSQNLAWSASNQRRKSWKDIGIAAFIGFVIGMTVRLAGKWLGI